MRRANEMGNRVMMDVRGDWRRGGGGGGGEISTNISLRSVRDGRLHSTRSR